MTHVLEHANDSEIEDLDAAAGGHLDVRGLEISMDDALLVRVFGGPQQSAGKSLARPLLFVRSTFGLGGL